MIKPLTIILFVLCSFQSWANTDQQIMQPINNLFDAMRAHDGEKLKAQFTDKATLERATKENSIHRSDLAKFAEFVADSDKYLDEQLFNVSISHSGNLASVWTPFAFYLDGKLSHCGVNSIQLVKQDAQWKIHYLIDNAYQGDCQQFINEQKAR